MASVDGLSGLEGALYLVSDKLQLATVTEIQAAEQALRAPLPPAYVSFISQLGAGACDDYLLIFDPETVATDGASAQEIFTQHARLWQEGSAVLSQEQVRGVIAIGHTIDGDYLTYHPGNPSRFYVLPRQDNRIYPVGPWLEDAWAWLSTSGVLVGREPQWEYLATGWQPIAAFHTFEPSRDRAYTQYRLLTPRRLDVVLDFLTALAQSEERARLIRYGDGRPSVQRLFLPNDRAAIHCQGYAGGVVQVSISYDPTEDHPVLDRLVAFLEQLGAFRSGGSAS